VKVDIGGGRIPLAGHINLDPVHGAGVWQRRFEDGIPCADGEADELYASHVMEHIPAGQPRIDCMNEAHRALRPGGTFTIRVPMFPTWQAIADPTHVSFWVPQSFDYFVRQIADADYGIRWWELGDLKIHRGWEIHCRLVRP
jgi:predicted SAM-dependent methyltransferase